MENKIRNKLNEFCIEGHVYDENSLSLMLRLTRHWKNSPLPTKLEDIETWCGNRIEELNDSVLNSVLTDHGIALVLDEKEGLTNRDSLKLARRYGRFIKELSAQGLLNNSVTLSELEQWWAERITEHFDHEGFSIHADPNLTVSRIVAEIVHKATELQHQKVGSNLCEIVLKHLVRANLELALGTERVSHSPTSTPIDVSGALGDFQIGATVYHVAVSPTATLIRTCVDNNQNDLQSIVVCPAESAANARFFTQDLELAEDIEVYCVEEYISTSLTMRSATSGKSTPEVTKELICKYNEIIERTETDRSLRIWLSQPQNS